MTRRVVERELCSEQGLRCYCWGWGVTRGHAWCRLKDPGARAVASWRRKLPALREVTFDNIGLCPEGCVDLDRVITDLKASVRFCQQNITCVYGEQTG